MSGLDTMKLWIDNRLDSETEKTFDEIKEEFINSKFFKEYKESEHIYLRDALINYLATTDGLHASFDNDDFERLYVYIRVTTRGL